MNAISIQRGGQAKLGEFWVGVMRVGRPDGIIHVQLMIDGPDGSRIVGLAVGEAVPIGDSHLKVVSVLDRDKGESSVEMEWGSGGAEPTIGIAPSDT